RRLKVTELLGHEGASDDQDEGDEATGDMQTVEAGRDVEGRAVGVGAQGDAVVDEFGVFIRLHGDEDSPEDEREDEPLDHSPLAEVQQPTEAARLEVLRPEDSELAREGAGNQDDRIDECKRDIEFGCLV